MIEFAYTGLPHYRWVRGLVLASLALCANTSFAGKPINVTKGEIALLPPYCVDTMGFDYGDAVSRTSPRAGYWVGLMGKSFWAVHHYCWGLIELRRVESKFMAPEKRRFMLNVAVEGFGYSIFHASQDFVLLPEMYTRSGEVYIMMDNIPEAYDAFKRARELKPDYWPAYSRWAAVLIKSGQKAEAKQLVKEGLGYSPDATELLQQYKLLGGDPSEIRPLAKAAAATQSTSSLETAPATSAETPPAAAEK